jgi:hypothetical protein
MSMNKLSWPQGWTVDTFHRAVHAVRHHRVPDFASEMGLSPKVVRTIVQEVEEMSAKAGRYIFDTSTTPEVWRPAPHLPRKVLASIEKVFVKDYRKPARILQLSEAGQDAELLFTRPCRKCGDMIAVTVGMAASAVRRYNLQGGHYTPPSRCAACRRQQLRQRAQEELRKRKEAELRVSVGEQQHAKDSQEPPAP